MKAIVYTQFGPPEVLQLKEVEKPAPKEDEVLVRVHASSVNHGDWSFVRGKPFLVRLMGAGLLKPKNRILGVDIAGRVEAVGVSVEQFQPGAEVFGDIGDHGFGGFAERPIGGRLSPIVRRPGHRECSKFRALAAFHGGARSRRHRFCPAAV